MFTKIAFTLKVIFFSIFTVGELWTASVLIWHSYYNENLPENIKQSLFGLGWTTAAMAIVIATPSARSLTSSSGQERGAKCRTYLGCYPKRIVPVPRQPKQSHVRRGTKIVPLPSKFSNIEIFDGRNPKVL